MLYNFGGACDVALPTGQNHSQQKQSIKRYDRFISNIARVVDLFLGWWMIPAFTNQCFHRFITNQCRFC